MQHAAFTEANKKVVKVVNFVAVWLNLYPRTVPIAHPNNLDVKYIFNSKFFWSKFVTLQIYSLYSVLFFPVVSACPCRLPVSVTILPVYS